jgi:hypothetical protein
VRYEFLYEHTVPLNGASADVFSFIQIDGPNPLTFVDEARSTESLHITGEIWVSSGTYVPLRILLRASSGSTDQEATVDYKVSDYAAVLPSETHHREIHDRNVTAENNFIYTNFKRFGASSGIIQEDPPQ